MLFASDLAACSTTLAQTTRSSASRHVAEDDLERVLQAQRLAERPCDLEQRLDPQAGRFQLGDALLPLPELGTKLGFGEVGHGAGLSPGSLAEISATGTVTSASIERREAEQSERRRRARPLYGSRILDG